MKEKSLEETEMKSRRQGRDGRRVIDPHSGPAFFLLLYFILLVITNGNLVNGIVERERRSILQIKINTTSVHLSSQG
jgi:hypothetical protein